MTGHRPTGPRHYDPDPIPIGPEQAVELWDGSVSTCRGFCGGLPVWMWGDAPATLLTAEQIRAAGLNRSRGQAAYGLLVWAGGRRHTELYRVDETTSKRTMTQKWQASISRMQHAHTVCRDCGTDTGRRLPDSTWRCDLCAELFLAQHENSPGRR